MELSSEERKEWLSAGFPNLQWNQILLTIQASFLRQGKIDNMILR